MSVLSTLLGNYGDDLAKAAGKVAAANTDDLARALAKNAGNKIDDVYRYDKSIGAVGNRFSDASGKPVTFYHSTPNDFSVFDDAKLGSNTGYYNTKLGHFVTNDKDFSKRFIDIDNTGKTGRTLELQAEIKKPITHPYMAGQKYSGKELDKIIEDYYKAIDAEDSLAVLKEYAEDDGQSLYDEYMDMTIGGEDPFESAADEKKILQNKGYDAVEIVEGPKNLLVDDATSSKPVSSYAIFSGSNLRPVRHIPVSQSNSGSITLSNLFKILNK